MLIYVIFSYLFILGAKSENVELPLSNILFAPIAMPMLIGKSMAAAYDHYQEYKINNNKK